LHYSCSYSGWERTKSNDIIYIYDYLKQDHYARVTFYIENLTRLSNEDQNRLLEVATPRTVHNLEKITPLSTKTRFRPLILNVLQNGDMKSFDASNVVGYITKMLNLSTREVQELNKAIETISEDEKSDF
jgi:hypothetical protein